MKAVILAAGKGSRLKPLSEKTPKPLLTINGLPVIDQIIKILCEVKINDIVIVTHHLENKIKSHLRNEELTFCTQKELLGTADALISAKRDVDGSFISLAADTIFKTEDLEKMINYFKNNDIDILVGLQKVPQDELKRRSTVKMSGKKISQIIEKPLPGKKLSNISAMPIFIFKDIIWKYLDSLKPSKSGIFELSTAIQNAIDDNLVVEGFMFSWAKDITFFGDIS